MKICYVGNFSQRHCTEVHIAATLEDLGHIVVRLQEDGYSSEELGNVIDQMNFDLFLFTRTWGNTVTLQHLDNLRKRGIPSASYHLDLYVGLSRKYLHGGKTLDEVLKTDPFWRTDFVFTPDGDPGSAEVFKRNEVNHFYMKPGVYRGECYMADSQLPGLKDTGKLDVLFVGGGDYPGSPSGYGHPEWPYRDRLIQWLRDNYGDRFIKKGHPQETVRDDKLNKLYAMFQVVVGDSVCLDFKHTYYWSDRVYETLGRGGFLIHPYVKGMEEEFKDGEHLIFYEYNNWDQLKEKIDYYLEHDAEREKIRKAGHEFVKSSATYHNRLQQMFQVIQDNPRVEGIETIKINLGAGSEPTEGWVNVDWIDQPGIQVVHNLTEFPWPFRDGSAEEIKAIDLLEHMPPFTKDQQSTPIKFIEECHRVLQTGGKLFITVPHWQSPNLWIDPTHVRGYDERSLDYFDPETDHGKWYGYYSDCKFKVSSVRTPNDNVEFTLIKRG